MNKIYTTIVFFLLLTGSFFAQETTAVLKGKITDEQGAPLPFANIILKENNIGTAADVNGNYRLLARPGVYTVEISFVGYEKFTDKVFLVANRALELDYSLKSVSFNIGGIEVLGTNDFIPLDPTTTSEISSGEIEHIQATSLSDVMQLIPGVETTNPTLVEVSQASIRGGEGIGTQIVMDGVPLSNTANMQEGMTGSSSGRGIDMRAIPAENIQKVEVIRGIPSAKYGDLTDGIIIVKTRSVAQSPRLKLKYNPNIYEANLAGGVNLNGWTVNGNFNLASSQRDIRIEGDGYTRLALQLNTEKRIETFTAQNILYFTRAFDERKEQPGYASRQASYNRDVIAKYTGNFDFIFSSFSALRASFSVNYTKRDSYEQALVSRDNMVITDRIEEGTQEGRIVFGSYLGKKWIKGDEWNIFADANYDFKFFTGEHLNSVLAGITWKNDFNNGEGIVFDPLFPPSLSISTPRLRTFNQIPAYNTLSLYLEDKITGNLYRPFTLQVGFRYEIYRPDGFELEGLWGKGDLISGKNGSYLNPRINFSYNVTESTQLRINYGTTSKAPNFSRIFAQDQYFDIVDTSSVVNPEYPDSNFSLISTFIRKTANPTLKASTQKKYEISIDQDFGFWGFTLTGFINKTENNFSSTEIPTTFVKRSFPNWPNVSGSTPKDTLLDEYSVSANNGYSEVKGIEFSIKTKKIPVISTVFSIDGAYFHKRSGEKNGYYIAQKRYVTDLGTELSPMYSLHYNISKDLLINYKFDIQAKSLGMWATIHIQQKLIEINGRRNYNDTLAIGYYTAAGELVRIPESERGSALYQQLQRHVESYQLNDEDKPNKWLVNLKVSKSLWKGAAISFFVNNLFNSKPLYKSKRSTDSYPSYSRRNPDIFYGIEFHSSLSGINL